jgi:acyl-CoA thioesterase-1
MRLLPFILYTLALILSPMLSAAEPRTVIVFGDSITEGNELPPADRPRVWVNLVQTQSQGRLHMVNQGKGGRPTASLGEFEHMLAQQPRPDILVIALGANDSRNIHDDCVPAAVKNLTAIIARARDTWGPQLTILLIAPTNIRKDTLGPTRPIGDQRDAKLRELGAAYQALATGQHCDFLSLYGLIPADSLTKDGVHPDAAGNELIAAAILPKLLSLVK